MEGKNGKWFSVFVALLLIFIIVSLGIPNAKAEWLSNASLSSSPSTVYREESTEFRFILYNDQFKRLDVSEFWVDACWLPSGTGWELGSASIPAYGDYTFKLYTTVPADASLGACEMEKRVTGKADGDWWSTTGTWSSYVEIKKRDPLKVVASGNPTSGDKPLTVYFSTTVSGGTPGYDYSWTFGDGASSWSKSPSHSYTSSGTYTAKIIVTDDLGRVDSDSITITVTNPPPPPPPDDDGDDGNQNNNNDGDDGDSGDGSTGFALSSSTICGIGVIIIIVIGMVVFIIAYKEYRKRVQPPQEPQQQYQQPPSQ